VSYWISLEDASGETFTTERHTDGGTYQAGGTTETTLNVTYNYGRLFCEAGLAESLRTLNEMTGEAAISLLEPAVAHLGTERAGDYWAATPGNAGYALSIILGWAREHPAGVFRVN
jgi:hypothetical protein